MYKNIAVIGASGAIGKAFTELLSSSNPEAIIHAFSRNASAQYNHNVNCQQIDYHDEASIKASALKTVINGPLDLVIVATGILHNGELMPEKSLGDLSAEKFRLLFEANTIVPALIIKHFLPLLNTASPSKFAVLSARVGSINDNKLGGWYAYRASKAALNMIIKNASIEIHRKNKQAVIVGLHPGTVESNLSKPFQRNVPEGKLFTAAFSANSLFNVINTLTPEQSGHCFAWDGKQVES